MLSFDRLRVLHAVSTTGSVVGAARTLHVTTSAVSQQLTRLEREVGQQLVERQGRGIRLTEAGTMLAHHAGNLLTHLERVEAGLAERRGVVAGTLAIAAFATAARSLLPGTLRELRSRYPDLSVSLSEREPHEAIPALRRGHLDIAVVQDWAEDILTVPEVLSRRDLLDDPFDVALPIDHRRGLDQLEHRPDLPRLARADPAQGWHRATRRAHRLRALNPAGAGGGRPGRRRDPAAWPRTRTAVDPIRTD
jgi:molybdate transport repressor ModE-like protein